MEVYRRAVSDINALIGGPRRAGRVRAHRWPTYSETRVRAFDDLVAWIERGVRPEGEDVLAPDLSRIGLKWTPVLHLEDPLAARR
jgi:hypothetical protein